jgi:hypothetical protein
MHSQYAPTPTIWFASSKCTQIRAIAIFLRKRPYFLQTWLYIYSIIFTSNHKTLATMFPYLAQVTVRMRYKILATAIVLGLLLPLNTQAQLCGFDQMRQLEIAQDSFAAQQFEISYQAYMAQQDTNAAGKVAQTIGSEIYVPVVFHLLGGAASAVTDSQIIAALAKVNADLHDQSGSTQTAKASANITLCLPQVQPSYITGTGVVSSISSNAFGIVRYSGSVNLTDKLGNQQAYSLDTVAYYGLALGGHQVDTYLTAPFRYFTVTEFAEAGKAIGANYINIYVVDRLSLKYLTMPLLGQYIPGIGGAASLPAGPAFTLVNEVFAAPSPVFAHEVGHYFGLYHTFEYNQSSTIETATTCSFLGDRCCDTPPVDYNYGKGNLGSGCPPLDSVNTVAEQYFTSGGADHLDMVENYMDYSLAPCQNTFTKDQVARMRYAALYTRFGLVAPSNIAATGLSAANGCAANMALAEFDCYTGTLKAKLGLGTTCDTFKLAALTQPGLSYAWAISPNTYSPSPLPSDSSIAGVQFLQAGIYTITLTVTRINGLDTAIGTKTQEIKILTCSNTDLGQWYFGDSCTLSFANGVASANCPRSKIKTLGTCAQVTYDSILGRDFYTNGAVLWYTDSNNHLIADTPFNAFVNGFTAQRRASQSTIICKRPFHNQQYFVYTLSNRGPIQNGISQYIVDCSSGIPVVTSGPLQPVENYGMQGNIAMVPHENGNDFWLIVRPISAFTNTPNAIATPHKYMLAYRIDSSGIASTPVASRVLPNAATMPLIGGFANGIQDQCINIAPNRKLIAVHTALSSIHQMGDVTICYFDAKTGLLTLAASSSAPHYRLPSNIINCFGTFSPNSRYYYCQPLFFNAIIQIDLQDIAKCTNALPYNFVHANNYGYYYHRAQIGPDARIYLNGQDGTSPTLPYLSVIENPDALSDPTQNTVGFIANAILPQSKGHYSLPTTIVSDYGATPNDFYSKICSCGEVAFVPYKAGTTFTWHFGDGDSIVGVNDTIPLCTNGGRTYGNYQYPIHFYQTAGTFTVTLVVDNNAPITHTVTISTAPQAVNIVGDFAPCTMQQTYSPSNTAGQNFWEATNASSTNVYSNTFTTTWQAPLPACLKLTNRVFGACGNAIAKSIDNHVVSLSATATKLQHCNYHIVQLTATPSCSLVNLQWQSNNGFASNNWVATDTITSNTTYTVIASNGFTADTVVLTVAYMPPLQLTLSADTICLGAAQTVQAVASQGTAPYLYSLNNAAYASTAAFSISTDSVHTISAKDSIGCISTALLLAASIPNGQVSLATTCVDSGLSVQASLATCLTSTTSYQWQGSAGSAQYGCPVQLQAGIYTLTATALASGCSATSTFTIQNYPSTSLNSTQPSCYGQSTGTASISGAAYLSLNGAAYSYTTNFSNLAAGTYTLYAAADSASTCIDTLVFAIDTLPQQIASATLSHPLCNGASTGSIVPSLSPAFGQLSTSSQLTALAAGSYTLALHDSLNCTTQLVVSITQPAALAIAATAQAATCNGTSTGSISTTCSGGTAPYSYSINGGTATPSGNFANLSAGSYTMLVQDSLSCTNTAVVVVSQPSAVPDFCCIPNVPSSALTYLNNATIGTGSSYTNMQYFINGQYVINHNATFSNCIFYFTAGSSISIKNGAQVQWDSCTMQAGCGATWAGIYTTDTACQVLLSNSYVYDSDSGIVIHNAKLAANNNYFGNNGIGMQLRYCQGANIAIHGNTFEGNLSLAAPHATTVYEQSGIKAAFGKALLIGGTASSGSSTPDNVFMHLPNGIWVNDVQLLAPPPGGAIPKCPAYTSYSTSIQYNRFAHITGGPDCFAPLPPGQNIYTTARGNAIYVQGSASINHHVTVVGNLSNAASSIQNFSNCKVLVSSSSANVDVLRNNAQNATIGIALGNCDGGVYHIDSNSIGNVKVGITKSGNDGYYGVTNNTITLDAAPQGLMQPNYAYGIRGSYATASNFGTTTISGNSISIPFEDYAIGISLENSDTDPFWAPVPDKVYSNTITFSAANPALPSNSNTWCAQMGVYLGNCKNVIVHSDSILANGSATALSNNRIAGIYLHASKAYELRCNYIDNTTYGIAAIGDNKTGDSLAITNNFIKTSTAGLLLRQLAVAGSVGDIGYLNFTASVDNDNRFTDRLSSNRRVLRIGDTCGSFTDKIVTDSSKINANNPNHNVSITFANAPNNNCKITVQNPFGTAVPYCTTPNFIVGSKPILSTGHAEDILEDRVQYFEHNSGATWLDRYLLMQYLHREPAMRQTAPMLDSFYLASIESSMGMLTKVDVLLATLTDQYYASNGTRWDSLHTAITTYNNAIPADDYIVNTAKQINATYLAVLKQGTAQLASSSYTQIQATALACPYEYGTAVYKARMLYSLLEPQHFYDDLALCNAVGIYRYQNSDSNSVAAQASIATNPIVIYPNPTSTTVNFESTDKQLDGALVCFYDNTGRLVLSHLLVANSAGQASCDVGMLPVGVCQYKLTCINGQISCGKLVIIR